MLKKEKTICSCFHYVAPGLRIDTVNMHEASGWNVDISQMIRTNAIDYGNKYFLLTTYSDILMSPIVISRLSLVYPSISSTASQPAHNLHTTDK